MKKALTLAAAVCLCGAMAMPASAVTTGKWDLSKARASVQQAARTAMAEEKAASPDWSQLLQKIIEQYR